MNHRIRLIDAFTGVGMRGNPAGVCILDTAPGDTWMQRVAEEMNQAETAFAWPEGSSYRLRWFTPVREVDLCGHATLACAYGMFADDLSLSDVEFLTRSGPLHCRRQDNFVEMDFPAQPYEPGPIPDALLSQLSGRTLWHGSAGSDFLAVFDSPDEVKDFVPDSSSIASVNVRGLIVTAKSEGTEFDFVSRFFAPKYGIPEDSVTGSAHCALAPFWAERLGQDRFRAHQASPRGGVLELEVYGDRVMLRGAARVTLEGKISLE